MTKTMQQIECPFGAFFANAGWKSIYNDAPAGAKKRLEVSFYFSQNHKSWTGEQEGQMFTAYRAWRDDVEAAMSREDLEYMVAVMDKEAAKEHYAALLKDRQANSRRSSRSSSGVKLMSYDDFFAMLDEQGEFKPCDCGDAAKKDAIIGEFLPVLENSSDPLKTHIEDILATATLKEARVYPKDEITYVRVEVRFLTETAEWSKPYQMLAAWDSCHTLMGYAFPVGKGRRTALPIELENPPSKAQREKRAFLMAERVSR